MEVSLRDFRRNITLEFDEAGQLVIAYNIYRCWPSEYQAMPELDAGTRQCRRDPEPGAPERGLGARCRRRSAG